MNYLKSFIFSPKGENVEKNGEEENGEKETKKGAYQIDFDKFDDPNFNPFETKTKVVNAFDEPGQADTSSQIPAGNILLDNVMKGTFFGVSRKLKNLIKSLKNQKIKKRPFEFKRKPLLYLSHYNL